MGTNDIINQIKKSVDKHLGNLGFKHEPGDLIDERDRIAKNYGILIRELEQYGPVIVAAQEYVDTALATPVGEEAEGGVYAAFEKLKAELHKLDHLEDGK